MGSGAFTHSSLEGDSVPPFGEDIGRSLSTLKTFSLGLCNSPFGNLSHAYSTHVPQKYAQAYLLTEVLLAGAKVWRQTKCLFIGNESNKSRYVQEMESDAAVKSKETDPKHTKGTPSVTNQ